MQRELAVSDKMSSIYGVQAAPKDKYQADLILESMDTII